MRIELEEGELVIIKRTEEEWPYHIKVGTYNYMVNSFDQLVETLRGLFGEEEEE